MARPASAPFRVTTVQRSVARRPILTRARTAPEVYEVPFARELFSVEEPFAPIEDVTPTSPVTAAIERHRAAEPQVAVVRRVALGRPASAGDLRASTTSAGPTHASRPQLRRAQTVETETASERVDVRLRRLSQEEFDRRRASAISFFKESTAINRLSRCSEASAALEAARRRRASAKVVENPQNAEEPEAAPAVPEAPPQRRSFAEQFGYGVILKTTPTQRQAQVLPEPPRPKMTGAFIGLHAGDTDLLQRLARRRRAASLGA